MRGLTTAGQAALKLLPPRQGPLAAGADGADDAALAAGLAGAYAERARVQARIDADLAASLAEIDAERARRRRERWLRESGLGKRFASRTFAGFEASPGTAAALAACRAYADALCAGALGGRNLVLSGAVGTGKTHLAAAVANQALDAGLQVRFGNFLEILGQLKDTFQRPGGPSETEAVAALAAAPLLVLDDLGKERPGEWAAGVLYRVINRRYEDMAPTVITTNLAPSGLWALLGDATRSRLVEDCEVLLVAGPDHRQRGGRGHPSPGMPL